MTGSTGMDRHHFAWLSIAAAISTIAFKAFAWWITGSVGLLSDALESFVNLAGASFALWMIIVTRAPADRRHPFGHGKAEALAAMGRLIDCLQAYRQGLVVCPGLSIP